MQRKSQFFEFLENELEKVKCVFVSMATSIFQILDLIFKDVKPQQEDKVESKKEVKEEEQLSIFDDMF